MMEPSTSAPRSRWSVVTAYAILAAMTQLLWVTFAPITTAASSEWHVSVDAVGWLSLVFPLVYVLLSIPFGIYQPQLHGLVALDVHRARLICSRH